MTIKGMEMMSTDPRSARRGWTFGEITNPRGGDNLKGTHFRAETNSPDWPVDKFDMFEDVKRKIYSMPIQEVSYTWEGKPMMAKWFEDLYSIVSALGVCFFPAGMRLALGPTYYSKLFSACTGWDTTPQDIMKLGERVFTLLKVYTTRQGFTRKDDRWANRFYQEPMPEGSAKGSVLSRETIDKLLDEYYELRKWDKESGLPSIEKLTELGLHDIAIELVKLGRIPQLSTG
jgi:aldehyde:ferredoxin oxidoreductase